MDTFEEKVWRHAATNKSIFDFSTFRNELHSHIEWKQANRNSKMFANILLVFLDIPNRIFDERKTFFISLCKKI